MNLIFASPSLSLVDQLAFYLYVERPGPKSTTKKLSYLSTLQGMELLEQIMIKRIAIVVVVLIVMSVFVDMDRMIGRDFESGLANLKTAAESRAARP